MTSMAETLLESMARSAARQYGGEAVSELEHALQCAELADAAGADDELVLAALLHDVGRYAVPQSLVSDQLEGAWTPSKPPRLREVPHAPLLAASADALVADGAALAQGEPASPRRGHHDAGADLIAPWVPPRVAWCVRMHADAKRYLCATEPEYYALLSPTSRRTLVMQGGVMSATQAAALQGHPWWPDALALRRWDDEAKIPGKVTRSLSSWTPLLRTYFAGSGPPR